MTGYASVVFDLDGTLVDSSHDIAVALNLALAPWGGRPLTAAEVVPLLGEGVAALVQGAVLLSGAEDAPAEEVAGTYVAEYRVRPVVDSVLYDGVAEALDALAVAGVPMAVCTNKVEVIAHQVLEGLGVARFFPVVVGGDRASRSKPHPEHLTTALAGIGADPATSVLVGDSVIDQRCAEAARVDFLAVSWAPPEVHGTRLPRYADLPAIVAGDLPRPSRPETR